MKHREGNGHCINSATVRWTHLGEDGVSAPLLMAKSRHRDLRTLSRYVRPGTKAVAQLTAEHDPARRGKHPRR